MYYNLILIQQLIRENSNLMNLIYKQTPFQMCSNVLIAIFKDKSGLLSLYITFNLIDFFPIYYVNLFVLYFVYAPLCN